MPAENKHVVRVGDIQARYLEGHVLQRLDVLQNRQREEEENTAREVRTARETSRLR